MGFLFALCLLGFLILNVSVVSLEKSEANANGDLSLAGTEQGLLGRKLAKEESNQTGTQKTVATEAVATSPQKAAKSLLPFPVSGTCNQGLTYAITSTEQLETYANEFPCIFALGDAPVRIPLGIWEGQILSVANTELVNGIGEFGWGGKLSLKSQCRDTGTEFYFIQNLVLGALTLPALTYIGNIQDSVGESSALPDGKSALFCDYTVHWEDVCPVLPTYKHTLYLGVMNSVLFGNANYDMLRVVGETADGGWIMLGRSMYRDVNNPSNGVMTAAWWYVTAYDSPAFEGVPVRLGPLEQQFSFHHAGLPGMIQRLNPFDNLAENFVGTLERATYYNLLMPFGIPPTGTVRDDYQDATLGGDPLIPPYDIKPGDNVPNYTWGRQGRVYRQP